MRIVESQGQARTHCTIAHDIAGGWRGTRTKATAHCSALQLEFTPHAGRLQPCGSEKIGHGSVGAIKHNPATPLACTLVAAMALGHHTSYNASVHPVCLINAAHPGCRTMD